MGVTNIAGYKFIPLTGLAALQAELLALCTRLDLKGTVLLGQEGINLNLAGETIAILEIKKFFQQDVRFADMTFRESFSATQPFKWMKVKLRKEIITMRQPEVRPEVKRAPSISPRELKQWLDDKREITLLDTRNDYEVRFGTFENAKHFQIEDFSEFPVAVKKLKSNAPVVMFCTGGIRCEKAALHMLNAGHENIFQLEGGILNYFSEVGGAHYAGECFVFDKRISVDTSLAETGTTQCLQCQGPIKKSQNFCDTCVHEKSA